MLLRVLQPCVLG
uniref:Uncharacterized protein n=1 Tax=Arundo donax TaxID=35708 RepID=A0A0A9ALH5_ARUDO